MSTRKPLVIYTAVVNGKDTLLPPLHKIPGADYVCFTNTPRHCSSAFECRPLPFKENSPRATARKIKLFAHQLFPDYERSIWTDGSKQIISDLTPLIHQAFDGATMAAFEHEERSCLYDEVDACITLGRENKDRLTKQKSHYQSIGIERNMGLLTSFVLFREHNDPQIIAMMERWWEHLCKHSLRDQVSLPVVMHEFAYKPNALAFNLHKEYFILNRHRWHLRDDSRNSWQVRLRYYKKRLIKWLKERMRRPNYCLPSALLKQS